MADEKEKSECNVKVVVRLRPQTDYEKLMRDKPVVRCSGERDLVATLTSGGKKIAKSYTFDACFDEHTSQSDLFDSVGRPVVEEVLKGFNCTIFAYGQTGTGKTFTMEGHEKLRDNTDTKEWAELAGVVPRAVEQIFTFLEHLDATEFTVRVSCIEIYNEEIIDLMATEEQRRLRLFEDPKRGITVSGAEDRTVSSASDIYSILDFCQNRRRTAETQLNLHSSRSHSIFTIKIFMKETTTDGEDLIKTGTLNLVDLAGSENVGRSGASGQRKTEAGAINQSLLTLGRVITALVEHQPHVPYRESKLTRLLQESLGGRTKTCIIATLSPSGVCIEETIGTLDYAFRAKNIRNRPEVNQTMSKKVLVKELTKRIAMLEEELRAQREKNGVFLPPERMQGMQTEISAHRSRVEELEALLEEKLTERSRVQHLFERTVEELEETKQAYARANRTLTQTQGVLQVTTSKLSKTTESLHETKVVLHERTKVAHTLHGCGATLMAASSALSSDVGGLFDKITREELLAKQNEQIASSYQNEVSSRINAARESVFSFRTTQVRQMEHMGEEISQLSESAISQLSALQAEFQSFKSIAATSGEANQQNLNQLGQLAVESLETTASIAQQHQAAVTTGNDEWKQRAQQDAARWMTAASQFEQTMALWTAKMQQQIQQSIAASRSFETSQNAALTSIADAVSSLVASSEERAQKIETHVSQTLTAQRETMEQENALIMETMQRMLAEATNKRLVSLQSQLGEVQTTVLEGVAETKKIAASCVQSCIAEAKVDLAKQVDQYEKEGLQIYQQSASQIQKEAVEKTGRVASECISSLMSHMEQMADSSSSLAASHADGMKNVSEQAKADLFGLGESIHNSMIETSQQLEHSCTSIEEKLSQFQRRKEEESKDLQTSLSSMTSNICTFSEEHSKCLENIHSAQLVLREYVPTGVTPIKREFAIPHTLPAIRAEEDILAEYRQQKTGGGGSALPSAVVVTPSHSSEGVSKIAAATSASAVPAATQLNFSPPSSSSSSEVASETVRSREYPPFSGFGNINYKSSSVASRGGVVGIVTGNDGASAAASSPISLPKLLTLQSSGTTGAVEASENIDSNIMTN